MNLFTAAFVAALVLETAMRSWLSTRQISAVRSHRDRVPDAFAGQIALADQQKAADYTLARVRLSRIATVVEAFLKLALTLGGGLALVDALVPDWPAAGELHGGVVLLVVFLVLKLLGLPFVIWRTFRIEGRFGFNRMSPRLFAIDLGKQFALGFAIGAPLAWATLMLMRGAGDWWWVWAWGLYVAVTLVTTWAAPRFIAPLFNQFKPITESVLKARVEALLERCGFTAAGGVFVMDGSRRSGHGNAYFTGIGRNKRIVFFDTLLARIDIAEIEAVLAHELGHFRLNHVRQRLATSLLAAGGGLALLGAMARWPDFYAGFGVRPGAAMALLLFTLTVPSFMFFLTPVEAWWSRRQELAADDFAVRHTNAGDLVSALMKLYRDNASTLTPDAVHSAFYDSHPPATLRIMRLKHLAAGAR